MDRARTKPSLNPRYNTPSTTTGVASKLLFRAGGSGMNSHTCCPVVASIA